MGGPAADGRWFGAVVLGYDEAGRPRRKAVSARTKEEARVKLRDLQRALEDGWVLTTGEETVAPLFERCDLDVLSTQVRPLARENYKSVADHHLCRCLARRR